MYVLVLHVTNFAVIKLAVMFIKEKNSFLIRETQNTVNDWFVALIHLFLSINLYYVWWNFHIGGMLKWKYFY